MPSTGRRTDNPRRPSEARRARSPGGPRVGGARERSGRALRVDDRRNGTQGWHDVRRTTRRRRRRALPPFGPAARPAAPRRLSAGRARRGREHCESAGYRRRRRRAAVAAHDAAVRGRRHLGGRPADARGGDALRAANAVTRRYRVGRSRDRLRSPGIARHAARAATGAAHGHRHRDRRPHSRRPCAPG